MIDHPGYRPQPPDLDIPAEWYDEFEAARLRPLEEHFSSCIVNIHQPVMDDAEYRSSETMAEYRQWCEANLPTWLGYGK